MKNLELFSPNDGWCHGPLFVINKRRTPKKDKFKTGWARRRAEEKAQPPWADRAAIRAIYRECKQLIKRDGPRSWCVDHDIPLNHPLVCGMHIAANLKIIPYEENQRKSNNWPPDQQGELF
jgi:hypothetical protein